MEINSVTATTLCSGHTKHYHDDCSIRIFRQVYALFEHLNKEILTEELEYTAATTVQVPIGSIL